MNQYRYILEGSDRNWIYSGSRNFAIYSNLSPGKYTFRVTGANNDGFWNEEGTTVDMIIHLPPWLTWYAYLIYLVLAACIILWIRFYFMNKARIRTALEVERIEKEKVLEMDAMKSQFFANISHEFRTPLTLILGPVEEFLKSTKKGIGLKKDMVRMIHRNAKRLQRLINQLLDLSKMETGELKLYVSKGDLEEFSRTIILSFLSLAESKKIRYIFELPGEMHEVWFDSDKVEKVLVNLISNAFKFTQEKGEVRIHYEYVVASGSEIPEWVEIAVSDTGRGISPEHLVRIFDRFYQVGDSEHMDETGTGIGLALTKELVELCREEISVDSQVEEGSTFTVRLPVSKERFREEERLTGPVLADTDIFREEQFEFHRDQKVSGKKREVLKDVPIILIVEDNIDLVNYISGNLENRYRILTAMNGKKGIELATESIPDLVISDVMMPEMDGMEMCRWLKEDERTSHIPVIMLTAKADRESKLEGLEMGADDYLIKPFDAEELEVRARNLIGQRQKLRDKFQRELITEPDEHTLISPEEQLLKKILDIFNRQLTDPEFNIEQMTDMLNLSRMQLYRKVGAITGHTPKELLRTIRLKKAASLLDSGERNISQVMYQVGFNNHSYFARCFRSLYKVNPSEYMKSES